MNDTHKNTVFPKIKVLSEVVNQLSEEFKTSETTVYNALKFFTFSEMAARIRERAMEIMMEIQQQNMAVMQKFHINNNEHER